MELPLRRSDREDVRRFLLAATVVLALALAPSRVSAYHLLYAEQYYQLYHEHLYQYPDDCLENIWYLQQALKADFANPLYALATIHNRVQWERYRYLFSMHVNLKLIEQYRLLASMYDKQVAYFYNYPWKAANLKSLDTAEKLYTIALQYWPEAEKWSSLAARLPTVHLEEIQDWEDESYRIQTGDLDYGRYLHMDLARLATVRSVFERMGPKTY